jgi:hypothetical protein
MKTRMVLAADTDNLGEASYPRADQLKSEIRGLAHRRVQICGLPRITGAVGARVSG